MTLQTEYVTQGYCFYYAAVEQVPNQFFMAPASEKRHKFDATVRTRLRFWQSLVVSRREREKERDRRIFVHAAQNGEQRRASLLRYKSVISSCVFTAASSNSKRVTIFREKRSLRLDQICGIIRVLFLNSHVLLLFFFFFLKITHSNVE